MNKTEKLVSMLIANVESGKYPPGSALPSRNQLTSRFGCSRTIVDRAIGELLRMGMVESRKGSGTYVAAPHPPTTIREVRVVSCRDNFRCSEYPCHFELLTEELLGVPVRWMPVGRTIAPVDEFTAPGGAVIWQMPFYEDLALLNALRQRVPVLLVNRDFDDFDNIRTDQEKSIRDGLSWLLIESGRDIAFVAHRPSTRRPFMAERLIATYRVGVELRANFVPERCWCGNFDDLPHEIAEMGVRFFGGPNRPRGIFVLNRDLALPLMMCAQGYGLQPGRDYHLLIFDTVRELEQYPGVGMIRQPYSKLRLAIRNWIEFRNANPSGKFEYVLKGDLLLK